MNGYQLDADRLDVYEPHSATLYHLSDRESEPSSLPFGFHPRSPKPVELPEPWMWWNTKEHA